MRLGAVRRLRWKRIGTASFRTVVGGIFRASVQSVVGLGRLVFRVGGMVGRFGYGVRKEGWSDGNMRLRSGRILKVDS